MMLRNLMLSANSDEALSEKWLFCVSLLDMITRCNGLSPQQCVCVVCVCARARTWAHRSESVEIPLRKQISCFLYCSSQTVSQREQKNPLCLQQQALLVHTLNLISCFPPLLGA